MVMSSASTYGAFNYYLYTKNVEVAKKHINLDYLIY